MPVVTGILVYVIVWWMVLFMVLPIGVRTAVDDGEAVAEGHANSAPKKPMLLRKVLITTGISGVLWLGIYLIASTDVVTLQKLGLDPRADKVDQLQQD